MPVAGHIKQYLDDQGLNYQIFTHREVYSSADEAKAVGTAASHVAKTLVIKTDGSEALAVLPASKKMDLHKLRQVLDDNHARLASEDEMRQEFPQFELGAVPPLGDLLGFTVYLDPDLERSDDVIFAGGSHRDSIRVSGGDFLKLTHPVVVDLAKTAAGPDIY